MPKFLSWDEAKTRTSKSGSGGYTSDGVEFLKLEVNKKYKVRLVGTPYEYLQHWSPVICRSPESEKTCEELVDPILQMGLQTEYPKPRYAMWVFDRNDGNKLKVMDFAPTMLDKFKGWKENFNEDPSGLNGPDWIIQGNCPGSDKRKTKWECNYLDKTPFTQEEKEAIKGGDLKNKLFKVRAPHTPDQIREMLAKKGAATQASAPAKTASSPSVSSTVVSAGKTEDFAF